MGRHEIKFVFFARRMCASRVHVCIMNATQRLILTAEKALSRESVNSTIIVEYRRDLLGNQPIGM